MNFRVNIVLWWVLAMTKQSLTEIPRCVQRRQGACKTLYGSDNNVLYHDEFHSPQPDGFLLKTSMQINLLDNIHSFKNNLRPVGYNLDNAALVNIKIAFRSDYVHFIEISLGMKYYRMAKLTYMKYSIDFRTNFKETKYNRYTPSLPTFPYNLNLELTINGTFSVYADGNTKPFLKYQLNEDFGLNYIYFKPPADQTDLIAFVDCSVGSVHCGYHRVDRLYGCKRWFAGRSINSSISSNSESIKKFRKINRKDVLFDQFVVVDTDRTLYRSSTIIFTFHHHDLIIEFGANSTWAKLQNQDFETIKGVRTEQWFEAPANPYAVRLLITTGENNNFLNITNLRNDTVVSTIISMNLCEDMGNITKIQFIHPNFYVDCFTSDDMTTISERPRKTNETDSELEYHEDGYNYTKTFLDTSYYVSEPYVIYQHKFGNSTEDWCPGKPHPDVFVTSKYDDDSLEGVIERANRVLHSDLQKINDQNNATADAVLKELKILSDSNKALLSEFRSVKTSIDALAKHLEQNTTTINNNYSYNNHLNITEFLKFLKKN